MNLAAVKSPARRDRGIELPPAVGPDAQHVRLLVRCLRSSGAGATAEALAGRLISRFGSLSAVLTASEEALLSVLGTTPEITSDLRALHALSIELARAPLLDRPLITSWTALLDYVSAELRHQTREQFRVLFLDKKNRLIADEALGSGTVDHAPVYTREVIRRALELSASALILVHNHPSGDPTPSQEDVVQTKTIVEATRPLRIVVHDHLIVGREVASLKALGLM